MRIKADAFIIFEFKEKNCTVLKYRLLRQSRKKIEASRFFTYAQLEEKEPIAAKIKDFLGEIGYSGERVILVISHKIVSSRFIRLPSLDDQEIQEMVELQAAKDLPYTPEEVALGYEMVAHEADGFSSINMVFCRRAILDSLLGIFREEGIEVEGVFLGTYGITALFNALLPKERSEVMLVGIAPEGAEIAVLNRGKIFLSRLVNLDKSDPHWKEDLFSQLMDTQSLYLRQGAFGPLKKVFLLGDSSTITECKATLDEKMLIPVEWLKSQESGLGIIGREKFTTLTDSLLGFMLKFPPESLNFLPRELKETRYGRKQDRLKRRLSGMGVAAVFILLLAFFIYTGNKKTRLKFLDQELQKIQSPAAKLEVMIKELEIFRNKRKTVLELLDYFAAVHNAVPAGVLVTSLNYDAKEKEAFLIRGAAQKLDIVFNYAAGLRELEVFRSGEIKVKQASNKVTKEGEAINFEIVFLRKK